MIVLFDGLVDWGLHDILAASDLELLIGRQHEVDVHPRGCMLAFAESDVDWAFQ